MVRENEVGNSITNVNKEKREELKHKSEAGDSPDNSSVVHIFPPPKVLDTQTSITFWLIAVFLLHLSPDMTP
jgi:hypothetical protein